MRWWLAAAFAVIASLTAVVVAEVFTSRSDAAFRARAQTLAAGSTFTAAVAVGKAAEQHRLSASIATLSRRHGLSLFVLDSRGRLMTPGRSRGVDIASVPGRREATATALAGHRFVASYDKGRTIVVALPIHRGGTAALVAVGSRPELVAENRIFHDEITPAALWAVFAGCIAGLVVATLITLRLKRIARAASEIEQGTFDRRLEPYFHDELGDLAVTVDRMRLRLRDSFANVESERDRLKILLERLHDGVLAVDGDLTVQFANAAAGELLGGASLETGRRLPDWEPFALGELARTLFAPGAATVQERIDLADGSTYTVVGLPAGGMPPVAVLVLSDVTAQERRERAEREFVANAAHELRTPLAAIASAVEVLENGAKDDALERERFLRIVSRQSGRLNRLVRALLVLARAQTHQEEVPFEPVRLFPVLEDVAAEARSSEPAAAAIRIDCPEELYALGQRDLIEEIVSNLTANAVKHGGPGEIVLRAAATGSDAASIEVHDSGPGIRPEQRERLFDRFYRAGDAGADGFGLGLAIVREAVRALGGRIEITARPGGGTIVRVVLEARVATPA
jgi:signal transduction histidine kinase